MTETPETYTVPAQPVVPAGRDLVDDLTVGELAVASRQLGCDVAAALADTGTGAGRRWDALPILAWLWAKRTDPRAKLTPFLELTASQLNDALGMSDDEPDADDADPETNPTESARVS